MLPTQIVCLGQVGFATAFCVGIVGSLHSPAIAQIVHDSTLPINSLVITSGNTLTIGEGTVAGNNLFHSFQEFNVRTGETAYFDNSTNITNIITRVTGGQLSNIDGLIRNNGTANLFLLNPRGIVFGANARLDIGGSFFGSTADSIKFADGNVFSATEHNALPLLSVNVPIGLQYGLNPGEIRVQGTGHNIRQPQLSPHQRGAISGLQVKPGNTLALVGGNITLEGGMLTAEAGRIELGSLADGLVSLSPIPTGWRLGYDGTANFRDITLLSKSAVDASGNPGGSIQVQGRNLQLRDASILLIQNQGSQQGGDIVVNLSGSLEASGLDPDAPLPSRLGNETVGAGASGNITISARQVVLQDAGQINNLTFSSGTSGDITLNVSDSVLLSGFKLDRNNEPYISNILAASLGPGQSGNVNLSSRQLSILDGGLVSSFVFAFGNATGNGGDVMVNATDSVEVIGFSPDFSGSSLSTTTFNAGNAGNVTVNTARLVIRDGGRVDANTIATGNAGSVTVNASDLVEISGTVPNPQLITPSLIGSAANIPDPTLQQFLGLSPLPSGDSGNVTINTRQLRVTDGALVTVKNDGTGNAGNLQLRADSIILDNKGGITASTASGEGGDITLQAPGILLLRHNSLISAEAGIRTGAGNGGNLTIDATLLVALENSDIIANAFQGAGGNIQINTQGIFGTQFRPVLTPASDITASSQFGLSGRVAIDNPEVDPSSGLVELPEEVTDPSDQVVAGCAAAQGNSFTVTGRGGLPEDPTATIRGQTVWRDLQDFSEESEPAQASVQNPQARLSDSLRDSFASRTPSLVEATGWVRDETGHVVLVAAVGNEAYKTRSPQCHELSSFTAQKP